MAVAQAVFGIFCVIVGVASVINFKDTIHSKYFGKFVTGIWAGSTYLLTGVIGLLYSGKTVQYSKVN